MLRPPINYVEDTWIRRLVRRGTRQPPTCPINQWNCYEAVTCGIPKTNNSVEGWLRAFSESMKINFHNYNKVKLQKGAV